MSPQDALSLEEAQKLILQNCDVLSQENIPLARSLHRFPASSLKALSPLPDFDGSLRDGYGIAVPETGGSCHFRIVDEVAAGDIRTLRLSPGEAVHIMTGGLIPDGCQGVVPQEQCRCEGKNIFVPEKFIGKTGFFIHSRGSNLQKGQIIVIRGERIGPEHQIDLAGVGYAAVPVRRRPRVAFFCTGSELLVTGDKREKGEKFSANPVLLQSLVSLAGADYDNCGNVADKPEDVLQQLEGLKGSNCDVIVSTGGMGPGRYDLVEEAFSRMGGQILYRSLTLRPGKSTLFGRVSGKLFFGLPGPPPAVLLLFNELVRPALLALQGASECLPRRVTAYLAEELLLKKRGLARLKSAAIQNTDGRCTVQPCRHGEPANAYIYCPADRRVLEKGGKVDVHLVDAGCSPVGLPYR